MANAQKTTSDEEKKLVAADDVQERASRLYRGELLAPMVRASTTPLRALALKYGSNACYTEELIDRSITGTKRIENSTLNTIDYVRHEIDASAKTKRRLAKAGGGGPAVLLRIDPKLERNKLICQIGTGEPEFALAAALHVHQDVDSFDINMGWYVSRWLAGVSDIG
jgi:tRNA-dihydrouridine synthase 2